MAFQYINFKYPARRKGAYTAAWTGNDDSLVLQVSMDDYLGSHYTVNFPCTLNGVMGKVCPPSGASVLDVEDEAIVAALRMSTLVSDTLVGSTEWIQAIQEGETANLQTMIGVVKVVAIRELNQVNIEIDVRKNGTSNPTKTLQVTRDQFPSRDAYATAANPEVMILPDFQARCCVPGEIEKIYPTYVHDYPNQSLTQTQKDNIITLVNAMDPWI